MEFKSLPLSTLRLDEENFRTGDVESQRAAIAAVLEEQQQKLVNHAEHIAENGLNPAEPLYVAPHPEEKGAYLVCEGNRRVTAIKILHAPELAKGTAFAEQFRQLSINAKSKPDFVLCAVFSNKTEAMKWAELKHSTRMEGRGLEKWGAEAQARYEASKGKVRRHLAVLTFLRETGTSVSEIEKGLKSKTTTADRVLNSAAMRDVLGVEFQNDGTISFANQDKVAGAKLLHRILADITRKSFGVRDVDTVEQRRDFLARYANGSVQAPAAIASASNMQGGQPRSGSRTTVARQRLDRSTLASRDKADMLHITDERINRLYCEARKLNVDTFAGTAAVLTRVLLELATDWLVLSKSVPLPPHADSSGKTDWSDFSLKEKIGSALRHLDPKKSARELDQARKAMGSKEWIHSIETLHAYVHDMNADPNPREIKQTWDRWFAYLRAIATAIRA